MRAMLPPVTVASWVFRWVHTANLVRFEQGGQAEEAG